MPVAVSQKMGTVKPSVNNVCSSKKNLNSRIWGMKNIKTSNENMEKYF